MKEIVKEVIKKALGEEGVREKPENMGKRVNEYQKADTLGGVGYAWCGSFVAWCIQEVDPKTSYCRSASCDVIYAWGRAHDIMHDTPQAGDIFLRLRKPGSLDAIHTGLVTKVNGGDFETIEGNTNLDGGSEGIGVFRRKRSNGNRIRFVRWHDLYPEDDAPQAEVRPYTIKLGPTTLEGRMDGQSTLVAVRDWGKALGFVVEWSEENQVVLFDGKEMPVQIQLIDTGAGGRRGFAKVRELAEESGLRLEVDVPNRMITVRQAV